MQAKNRDLEAISEYIYSVQFKKRFFGVNESEVYSAIEKMQHMYQNAIEDIQSNPVDLCDQRERVLERNEQKIQEIKKKAASTLEARKEDQKKIKELEKRIQKAKQSRNEYRVQTDQLAESIADTKRSKNQIIRDAKIRAEEIVEQAKRHGEAMKKGISEDTHDAWLHCLEQFERLELVREKTKDSLQMIQIDLCNMRDTLLEMQNEMGENKRNVGGDSYEAYGESEEEYNGLDNNKCAV